MVEQLEAGLTYDHIGISLMDYTTRELVVQAGKRVKRRGALGRRLPLDAGLMGQVARTGKAASFRSISNNQTGANPVFPESQMAGRSSDFLCGSPARRLVCRKSRIDGDFR